jgi:hypothetical protein
MTDDLKTVCLELAATANGDPLALQIVAGRVRLVCGWHYGSKGLPLEEAEIASEVLIAKILDEHFMMNEGRGRTQ